MNFRLLQLRTSVVLTVVFLTSALALPSRPAFAQSAEGLDRVMMLTDADRSLDELQIDRGGTGLWQDLQKLRTTASVLHVVAHPDDEHGGVLTYLSRGEGARVALLSLTRGEGGANAVGSELFDELGLVRTEELLLSGAYYGLDDLYFTTAIDYGFSKVLDEALRNWGRENVLRDVVRVIRLNRPLVVLARFHGTERDGHGHHETAGVMAQEAFRAAADPNRFPEQISEEGLQPWQPLKLYRGGVREDEHWNVRIDAGTYSSSLGASYRNVASEGLQYQRSQTSGAYRESVGPYVRYYERMDAVVESPDQESSLFDGIDTSLRGLPALFDVDVSAETHALLEAVMGHVDDAVASFNVERTATMAASLALGLEKLRRAMDAFEYGSDAHMYLQIKERQFEHAINTALGVRLEAVAVPPGTVDSDSPWGSRATMGIAVPGQDVRVQSRLVNAGGDAIHVRGMRLDASSQWTDFSDMVNSDSYVASIPVDRTLSENEHVDLAMEMTVPADAGVSHRYYYRESIRDSRYDIRYASYRHRPHRPPLLTATATYTVYDVPVGLVSTVRRREANFPYGYEMRALKIAPVIAVNMRPEMRIVPLGGDRRVFDLDVELVNNRPSGAEGVLRVDLPAGWRADPARNEFSFTDAGQRRTFAVQVEIPTMEDRDYLVEAVAMVDGEEYRTGYEVITQLDIDTQYIFRPAETQVRGVDVQIAPDLTVGYVMGVGDEVPSGIRRLGARVDLFGTAELAGADLSGYDVIVVGTRAYAVRQDLWTYNQRLLDYARNGGHLIVLYQTPEFVPNDAAAFPAELPRSAEEVSEEDAPVRILAPEHPVFNQPNEIAAADFDGWIEQRGSKFFSEWDDAYTPLIETQDLGQDPQQGGWLIADYGAGTYTYFAYAVHRQLPYGVPGAYRIFANLLSLGR
ncbi:MAG: PIG-L family deacetylase [Rhodothermales bacterium]